MTCDETRDTLSVYLDEALAPEERSLVDAHLLGCAECRRELETLRETVALLQRVEPVRAPVGFVDRVMAAARPRPWYRRAADAVLLPLSVKLPLEAAALLMVGLLAVYLFERSPELQRAARDVAPPQEAAAPAKEKAAEPLMDKAAPPPVPVSPVPPVPVERPSRSADARARADAPVSREVNPQIPASPPAVSAPAAPAAPAPPPGVSAPTAAAPPPMAVPPPAKKESAPSENVAGAAARSEVESRPRVLSPSATEDSARTAPSSSRLGAKRVLPSADVVARVAVRDRDAAERELAALVARLGGSLTLRRREDEATVVEAVIPQPRYAEFSESVGRIGAWQLEAARPDLPAQVHVILRLQ